MTDVAAVAFDPFEPGFVEWPYDQYARLRREDPVHRSELLEGWVLTRYDDVNAVLRDSTVSVELQNATPTNVVQLHRERMRRSGRETYTLVLRDDPAHNRIRKLLQRPFGPRPVERLREMVTARVDAAFAEATTTGRMDVITDFAYPLPVTVFCEMLGIPDEDSPRFRDWTMAVAQSLDPLIDEASHARALVLISEMYDYLDAQAGAKRRSPGDDVLSELVGDDANGDRLVGEELVAQLVTLYVAGHEPITGLVGNGLLALLRHPSQLALLRERRAGGDDRLMSNAVHELLRFDGPNQFVRRIAVQPLTLGDHVIQPGEVMYLGVGAANHDPARWGDADQVRVERQDAPHHVQFGSGIHACLGAHLARLVSEIALGALVTRLDDLALAGDPVWSDRMVLRGLQSLPVSFRQ